MPADEPTYLPTPKLIQPTLHLHISTPHLLGCEYNNKFGQNAIVSRSLNGIGSGRAWYVVIFNFEIN